MLQLLRDPQLIRLDAGIFILHFVLTAMFVAVPIILLRELNLSTNEHWSVYLPAPAGVYLIYGAIDYS